LNAFELDFLPINDLIIIGYTPPVVTITKCSSYLILPYNTVTYAKTLTGIRYSILWHDPYEPAFIGVNRLYPLGYVKFQPTACVNDIFDTITKVVVQAGFLISTGTLTDDYGIEVRYTDFTAATLDTTDFDTPRWVLTVPTATDNTKLPCLQSYTGESIATRNSILHDNAFSIWDGTTRTFYPNFDNPYDYFKFGPDMLHPLRGIELWVAADGIKGSFWMATATTGKVYHFRMGATVDKVEDDTRPSTLTAPHYGVFTGYSFKYPSAYANHGNYGVGVNMQGYSTAYVLTSTVMLDTPNDQSTGNAVTWNSPKYEGERNPFSVSKIYPTIPYTFRDTSYGYGTYIWDRFTSVYQGGLSNAFTVPVRGEYAIGDVLEIDSNDYLFLHTDWYWNYDTGTSFGGGGDGSAGTYGYSWGYASRVDPIAVPYPPSGLTQVRDYPATY
jgi:hypothetical protein